MKVPPTSTPRIATRVLCIAVPIRAFLFDFDGLIIDTETASRAGWRWLYEEHGHELPDESGHDRRHDGGWDPMGHLEELVGSPIDRDTLNDRRYGHELSLLEAEELRPGIPDYLAAARANGLKRAIVSSASRRWIDMHLRGSSRQVGWDAIITADRDDERAKPNPTLYLEALDMLGVPPTRRSSSRTRRTASRRQGRRDLRRRRSRTTSRATPGSTRPTSSSSRSPTCRRTSCSRASADARTSAVATAPATTTAQSGARSSTATTPRCDAGEPRVDDEWRPLANVSVTTSAARIAGATSSSSWSTRGGKLPCPRRRPGRPPSAATVPTPTASTWPRPRSRAPPADEDRRGRGDDRHARRRERDQQRRRSPHPDRAATRRRSRELRREQRDEERGERAVEPERGRVADRRAERARRPPCRRPRRPRASRRRRAHAPVEALVPPPASAHDSSTTSCASPSRRQHVAAERRATVIPIGA